MRAQTTTRATTPFPGGRRVSWPEELRFADSVAATLRGNYDRRICPVDAFRVRLLVRAFGERRAVLLGVLAFWFESSDFGGWQPLVNRGRGLAVMGLLLLVGRNVEYRTGSCVVFGKRVS